MKRSRQLKARDRKSKKAFHNQEPFEEEVPECDLSLHSRNTVNEGSISGIPNVVQTTGIQYPDDEDQWDTCSCEAERRKEVRHASLEEPPHQQLTYRQPPDRHLNIIQHERGKRGRACGSDHRPFTKFRQAIPHCSSTEQTPISSRQPCSSQYSLSEQASSQQLCTQSNDGRDGDENARTLFDTIRNGVLDVNAAARIIIELRHSRSLNEEVYNEFVSSEAAARVHKYKIKGLSDLDDPFLEMQLNSAANMLMSEIQLSKIERLSRIVENKENTSVKVEVPLLSLKNLTRDWKLQGSPPFKTVDLPSLLLHFKFRRRETAFQQYASLFRYILVKLTDPPSAIQNYAVRLNYRQGKPYLHHLPEDVENILLDFSEDLSGLGHNELKIGAVVNPSESRFFLSLGHTNQERAQRLEELTHQRIELRPNMFDALQMALRDVRSYTYDSEKKEWRSQKDKKRAALEEEDDLQQVEDI